jgi:hypothetical protein
LPSVNRSDFDLRKFFKKKATKMFDTVVLILKLGLLKFAPPSTAQKNMKTPRSFTRKSVPSHPLRLFFSGVAIFAVAAFALAAESDAPKANAGVTGTDTPPSMKSVVQVMVELDQPPGAAIQAEAYKAARAQADAERTFALANPTAPGSQAILQSSTKVKIGSAAANQVKAHVQQIKQTQQGILPSLTGAQIGGQVLYSVQRAYNQSQEDFRNFEAAGSEGSPYFASKVSKRNFFRHRFFEDTHGSAKRRFVDHRRCTG